MLTNFDHNNSIYAKKLVINLFAICLVISCLIFFSWEANQITQSASILEQEQIRLDLTSLCFYSMRTLFRMIIAIILSIIFSIIYALLASKSQKLEQTLIPILDILQSVPILGYISFTVAGFVSLAPNSVLGFEMAAIFAIFTSQAWNITFSIYQAFKNPPQELIEMANSYGFNSWRKFWSIELPYAVPGIIWNSIISMSGGWVFVVAAENIVYGSKQIQLPGIGSYIAVALQEQNMQAIISAVIVMVLIIILFNKIFFQLLIDWSSKFRYELTSNNSSTSSDLSQYLYQSIIIKVLSSILSAAYHQIINFPFLKTVRIEPVVFFSNQRIIKLANILWSIGLIILFCAALKYLWYFFYGITLKEIFYVFNLTCITFLRVVVLLALASLVLLPLGIYIGFKPNLTKRVQPIIQIMASFPSNLLFPLMVICIDKYHLNPNIWLSPLMVVAAQWYILFNVIAGTSQIPSEYLDIMQSFKITTWNKYKNIILPAILPYYITGLITASGASWNASIIAEAVTWGNKTIYAQGIGSYITYMSLKDDHVHIALGIVMMCLFVVVFNKVCWHKMQIWVNEKFSNKL